MTLLSTISKWGNGQGIRLPKTLLELLKWENNDKLETKTINEKDDKKVSQTLNQEVDLSFLTGNKVKTRDIIIFLQNLLVLKEANFNNIDALNMIIKSTESKTLKNIIRETLAGIESGEYMYETMEKYPKIFPFIVTNIIKVGELSRNNG